MTRTEKTEIEAGSIVLTKRAPVLAVRLGRGRTGGTTFLDWLIQRARNQGREVIVADGDRRNADLAALYPGQAMQPPSDDTGDVKEWITSVLVGMAETEQSVALDLGGGDATRICRAHVTWRSGDLPADAALHGSYPARRSRLLQQQQGPRPGARLHDPPLGGAVGERGREGRCLGVVP